MVLPFPGQQQEGGLPAVLGKGLDFRLICCTSRDWEWAALRGFQAQAGPHPVLAKPSKGQFGPFILRQRHFSCPAIFSMREEVAPLILFLGSERCGWAEEVNVLPTRERQRVRLGARREQGAWLKPEVIGRWPARLRRVSG